MRHFFKAIGHLSDSTHAGVKNEWKKDDGEEAEGSKVNVIDLDATT